MIEATINIEAEFADALAAYGLNPPEIIADGVLHRFDGNEDKRGKKSAWYILHGDEIPAGAFGDWKTGLSEKWCSKTDHALTPVELAEYRLRIDQAKRHADAAQMQAASEAVVACSAIMATAQDATDDNPYCIRKGIKPYGLKEFKDKRTLIVPIRDGTGALTSLQFIGAEGKKRFKSHGRFKGCYYAFGGKPVTTLLICEGFATGASLHAVTGHPIAVAFNGGNMEAVARVLRAKFPAIQIVICADNDRFNDGGNGGIDNAKAAAQAVGGMLAIPDFASDDGKPTDFNDLHQREGALAVLTRIGAAAVPTTVVNSSELAIQANSLARAVKIRCGTGIKPLAITWLWDGWLPAGKLTILAGAAGTGKTTLALGLAAALTSGGRWPDGSRCSQSGNVLIWSSEDVADDTLVPRLIASGADLSRCHFIEGITQNGESVPFDPAQDIFGLHKVVENIGGVSLLLIDPIVSAVAGDMHRANDVRRSLQSVVDFAEAHQCAVVGITHFAKGGAGKAPQDRVIGSQAFGALARMVLVAAKEEDGTKRVLARAKSNIAPDDGGIAYSLGMKVLEDGIEATHAVWEGTIAGTAREILGDVEHDENGDGSEKLDAEQFLKDLLADGPVPTKQVKADAAGAGYAWRTIERAKRELGIEAAKSGMSAGWQWFLPKTANNREDRHRNSMAAFDKFGGLRSDSMQSSNEITEEL
jgi:putative DNA primase/helicase